MIFRTPANRSTVSFFLKTALCWSLSTIGLDVQARMDLDVLMEFMDISSADRAKDRLTRQGFSYKGMEEVNGVLCHKFIHELGTKRVSDTKVKIIHEGVAISFDRSGVSSAMYWNTDEKWDKDSFFSGSAIDEFYALPDKNGYSIILDYYYYNCEHALHHQRTPGMNGITLMTVDFAFTNDWSNQVLAFLINNCGAMENAKYKNLMFDKVETDRGSMSDELAVTVYLNACKQGDPRYADDLLILYDENKEEFSLSREELYGVAKMGYNDKQAYSGAWYAKILDKWEAYLDWDQAFDVYNTVLTWSGVNQTLRSNIYTVLGEYYFFGVGGAPRDRAKAKECWERSGSEAAEKNIAVMNSLSRHPGFEDYLKNLKVNIEVPYDAMNSSSNITDKGSAWTFPVKYKSKKKRTVFKFVPRTSVSFGSLKLDGISFTHIAPLSELSGQGIYEIKIINKVPTRQIGFLLIEAISVNDPKNKGDVRIIPAAVAWK